MGTNFACIVQDSATRPVAKVLPLSVPPQPYTPATGRNLRQDG